MDSKLCTLWVWVGKCALAIQEASYTFCHNCWLDYVFQKPSLELVHFTGIVSDLCIWFYVPVIFQVLIVWLVCIYLKGEGNLSQVCSVFHEIHCLYELTGILHIYHTKLWLIWLSSGKPPNGLFLKLLGCISNHQSFVSLSAKVCAVWYILSWCALWITKGVLYLTDMLSHYLCTSSGIFI